MSTFDPIAVRRAVAEFTPRRPRKFQDLFPAKEVIMELREKRASYRAIAELLTQHCLPASKTHIAMFCHQVLGETVRPHRRSGRRRQPAVATANTEPAAPAQLEPTQNSPENQATAPPNGAEPPQGPASRVRGPRIAQVRTLPTGSSTSRRNSLAACARPSAITSSIS